MSLKTNQRHEGFTLVEIMIVVAIIALLAAIAVPGFLRARNRSQATTVLNTLRLIDAAKDQYAVEFSKTTMTPNGSDLQGYFKSNTQLYNVVQASNSASIPDPRLNGIVYDINGLDSLPSCSASDAFSDVTDPGFWSPYPVY